MNHRTTIYCAIYIFTIMYRKLIDSIQTLEALVFLIWFFLRGAALYIGHRKTPFDRLKKVNFAPKLF